MKKMSSSTSDREYFSQMEQLKLNQKCDADEEESWISGEELITEESTDEEDEKCKSKSRKHNAKSSKGKKKSSSGNLPKRFSSTPITLPPINRESKSTTSTMSTKSTASSIATSDENFNDEEAPCWRPKRGSIKLSDLEGYQLVQMQENQLSDEMNSSGNVCQDYSNSISTLSLDFLKDIELNDLHDILKKYLNEDEISTCDYLSDDKQCLQDARDFGGIYVDLINRDPSLNDVLVQMNNLDKLLNEKTENADKFLIDEKSKTNKNVKVTKCYKNIHSRNPRKLIRPATSLSKNRQNSAQRAIKSADFNINPKEITEDNSNPIKLSEEQTKRIEEILANEEPENEENIKLNPGEGFTLSTEDYLTLESIDLKLKSLYSHQSASQALNSGMRKLKLCHENEFLKTIDSKLEILQRNKNCNEVRVTDDELNKLLQSLQYESVTSDQTSGNSSETDTVNEEIQSSVNSNLETFSLN